MTIKEKNMHLWRAFFEKIIKGEPVPNFTDSYTGEPWPAGAFPVSYTHLKQRGDELPVPVLQGDKRRQQQACLLYTSRCV